MRRLVAAGFGALLALPALPVDAWGQEPERVPGPPGTTAQGRSCRQVLPSDFRRIVNSVGQEVIYFRDPVRFLCTNSVRLEADSAVVNRSAATVELIGRVVYQDSTRELKSEWANYLGRMDQLVARDDVVLRDLEGGAVVRGDQLSYLRATAARPESRMIVTGGRPHATIPPPARRTDPSRPGASPDADGSPTEVRADRMEARGENLFEATGNVELERGEMVGAGRSAAFDQRDARMTLTGDAFVENPQYRLEGDRIDAFLEGDALREVFSEGSARVISQELSVDAERVRIGFAAGELERLEAWNPDPATATRRARADAEDFRLRADSIDAQADSRGIRELRAVGRAYGERDLAVATAAPDAALPAAVARDWIQGDTIHGFFERVPLMAPEPDEGQVEDRAAEGVEPPGAPGGDSTRVVLERIIVVGASAPALSFYRMASGDGSQQPALNFMKATRIILFMEQGELARVEAEGPIEGLYLDPSGRRAGGGADTEGEGRR